MPDAEDDTTRIVVMRESFTYPGIGRRDPFFSLLQTAELRPTLGDLKLNFVLHSAAGGSTANLADQFNNKTITVRVGTQLGRMRVVAINPRSVVFAIDDFGATRRDSLVLRPDPIR
jgi:hypothetical protein